MRLPVRVLEPRGSLLAWGGCTWILMATQTYSLSSGCLHTRPLALVPEPVGALLGSVPKDSPEFARIAGEAARTIPGYGYPSDSLTICMRSIGVIYQKKVARDECALVWPCPHLLRAGELKSCSDEEYLASMCMSMCPKKAETGDSAHASIAHAL